MKTFLALPIENQGSKENAIGIPSDSTNNQLKNWVRTARIVNKDIRIAIKADQTTGYPHIKHVMNILQDLNENRYNLITSLEADPTKKQF